MSSGQPDGPNPTVTWRLRLQVNPVDEAPFDAQLIEAVPAGEKVSVGQRVAVLYDPDDHDRVAIDHRARDEGASDEAAASSEGLRGAAPAAPAQIGLPRTNSIADATVLRRGMFAHPSAGPKLSSVSRKAGDGAPEGALEDRLAQLASLRDRGALTAAEFEQQRREILGG